MGTKIQEHLIGHLQTLYTIVIAIALTNSIEALIKKDELSFKTESIPIVICFLLILIPFYLGACRYQDTTYISTKNTKYPHFAPFWDFIFFFCEAIVFYLMSLFIIKPREFVLFFMILLMLDVAWLLALKIQKIQTFNEIKLWLVLNIITTPIIAILYFFITIDNFSLSIAVMIISFIRTYIDFKYDKEFYLKRS